MLKELQARLAFCKCNLQNAIVSIKKAPQKNGACNNNLNCIFYHPDFTVGLGIAPNRPPKRFADFTAGRELHPTPKILYSNDIIISPLRIVKLYFGHLI